MKRKRVEPRRRARILAARGDLVQVSPATPSEFAPMSLSSLSTALLIPPINLVPIGLAGLVLARFRPRLGRALALGALLGLLGLAMPVTGQAMMYLLMEGIPATVPERAGEQPAAIVVLSGDGASGAEGGLLRPYGVGPLTLQRLHAGAQLARRLRLPVLLTGGALNDRAPPIALDMARVLREDFGIADSWVETRSADTWENAEFSARILKERGVRRVFLVTSGWHLRRALIAFSHVGLDVVPVADRMEAAPELGLDAFVPRVSAWLTSYYAIHEWIGCAYYLLRR